MSQTPLITLAATVTFRPDGATARELPLGPRARVAFAFLLLERDRPVPLDELADAVWGEQLPDTWRPALRLLVSRLRTTLVAAGVGGRDVVRNVGGCYELRVDGDVVVDVESVTEDLMTGERALRSGDPAIAGERARRALAVARGRFLPGDGGVWVERRQADLHRSLLEGLDLAARAAAALGDHAAAVAAAAELVALAPWEEGAHVRLAQAHAAAGNGAAARRAADECRRRLAAELGVPLSAEAERAFADLSRLPGGEPSSRGRPGNLRRPVSTFVGRAADLAALTQRAPARRVLTLVGPAGVGKSRLAVELADRLSSAYPDGVWRAELAGLAGDGPVAQHVLDVLGLPEVPGRSPSAALVEHLVERDALILLDNCEHVLGPCAALVEELAGRCPGVDVLATSRICLGIVGETVWPVAPLALPPEDGPASLAELLAFDAVQLFVDRAAAAAPALRLDDAPGPLARICRQLDGLPLAIELAAARTRTFAVTEIEGLLRDRFRFLVSAGGRTLEAAIDWSYGTLGSSERRLFTRIALFSGGCSLEGIRAVCGVAEGDLVDALSGLVDRSLVVAEHRPGIVRYWLLETMRQYALQKLTAEGDAAVAAGRDGHLAWAVDLAEAAEPRLDGPEQAEWLGRLQAEEENFRAALDWAATSGADVAGLRLAVALWRFWEIRGRLAEGRARLEAMAGRPGGAGRLRARALNGAGILAQRQADWAAAQRLYQSSLAEHERLGDRRGVAAARNGVANLAVSAGDLDLAEGLFAENVVLGRALGDERLLASSLLNLAVVQQFRATTGVADRNDALALARTCCEESLRRYRALGDRHSQAMALENLGSLVALQGDTTASRRFFDESLALRRDLGDRAGMAAASRFLGQLARRDGRHGVARTLHEDCLSVDFELGNDLLAATDLLALGEIAADQDCPDEARRYFERSLVLYRGLGDDDGSGRALVGLARLAEGAGWTT